MFKTISNKLFPLQITKKVYIWMIILIIIPTTILSIITYLEFLSFEKNIVKHQLYEAASELSYRLEDSLYTYPINLEKKGTLNEPIDQHVNKINNSIQPLVDKFIKDYPELGVGVYSLSLERVVAFGPNFVPSILNENQKNILFHEPDQNNNPEYTYTDQSITWKNRPILNLTYPIFYNKKIIGYLWCNIKLNDIYIGALLRASKSLLVGFILSGIFILLSWRIFTRFKNELVEFANAVAMNNNNGIQEGMLPELTTLLKLINESENKYRTIFENTGTAMSISEEDTTLSLVNMEFEKLTGYSKEEIENKKSWAEFIADEYSEKLKSYYKLLFYHESKVNKSVELKMINKAGNIRDVLVTIAIVPGTKSCVASILDITEQRRSEQELILSMDRFYKTFHSTPSSMSITRISDGKIIDINNGFRLMSGYTFEEVYNRTINEINLWKYPEETTDLLNKVNKKGYIKNIEIVFLRKSGEERDGLLSAEKIELDGEECIITLVMDITERKQLKTEIQQLERLNLIGEMAAGIGHEIRNPMTTVRGFLQLLANKDEYCKDKSFFDLMIEELDRANAIIKEYLTLAKNKSVDLVSLNINNIIQTLFPLIQADAIVSDKYIKLDLNNTDNLLLDEKEIRQLILNLTRNGLEAMNNGGTLTISTYMENNKVVLSVQDQGKGIDSEIADKIGTPFFTTKEYGTGLGLAVCYSIAARHNATLEFKSNSSGTTFNVYFEVPNNN